MTSEKSSTPISTLIKSLCEESRIIRNNLCSALSKSKFDNIVVTDMCGSGNSKVRKDYLSKTIIELLKHIEQIDESLNPVFNCDNLSEMLDNICDFNNNQFQSDINSQLASSAAISEAVGKAMKQHSSDIEKKLSELVDTVSKFTLNSDNSTLSKEHSSGIPHDRECCVPDIKTPEPAYCDYRDNFLTGEEEDNLIQILSDVDFGPENGHSVKKIWC